MPTRKQRRRQEKLRRHEWEEVWVDDEGQEIEPPPEVAATVAKKAAPTTKRSAPARGGRAGRQVSPPSWNKVARRGAIFAPIMFVVVYELQKKSHRSAVDALYYTTVTLTTTGYGDITPVDPFARGLANLEAVIGQFYLAITVARLIALEIADRRR